MTLYIRNMVCLRCKMAVQSVLEGLSIRYSSIELGKVALLEVLSPDQQKKINAALQHYKLELMDDKRKILVERIKILIIELLHSPDNEMRLKLSEYLSKGLHYDYTYLSNIFSEMEGSTIERFYIVTRIERVKELIVYEDLSVTEIAYQLNYSSVSHLCLQFKKVTGQTPSMFRKKCESGDFVWRICE
ncbi:MAG: helix-turn-helix transcriptional regulator [Chitinophagaceae bacterium]|nr:helix-turn-helix transcriptional regulator [Chitinophagaceae bacterium]